MKKELIFIYIISIVLLLPAVAQAQTQTVTTKTATKTTSIALPSKQAAPTYKQRYGLRVGADISRLIIPFFNKDYYGLEFVGDYRLSQNYYAAAEIGFERKATTEDFFAYTTQGQYLRLGFDYNSYGNWYGMENMIYVGARYGISLFSQELTSYTLHKDNQYFDESVVGTNPFWLRTYNGRTAHWLEVVIGLKAELLRNFYAGISMHVGCLVLQTDASGFPNYYIPAFGRVYENSRFGTNFNYTFSYLIPLYKKNKETSISKK